MLEFERKIQAPSHSSGFPPALGIAAYGLATSLRIVPASNTNLSATVSFFSGIAQI